MLLYHWIIVIFIAHARKS